MLQHALRALKQSFLKGGLRLSRDTLPHNVYNTVDFALSTHDAGNKVTGKDRDLAKAIDEIFERFK